MKRLTVLSIAILLAGSSHGIARAQEPKPAQPAATATATDLEGKSFKGQIIEEGKTKGSKDTLSFKGGKFTSSACTKYGFLAAPYTVTADGGKNNFTVLVTNKKGEKMDWKGTVEGGKIAASAVYTNKKGKALNYTFKPAS